MKWGGDARCSLSANSLLKPAYASPLTQLGAKGRHCCALGHEEGQARAPPFARERTATRQTTANCRYSSHNQRQTATRNTNYRHTTIKTRAGHTRNNTHVLLTKSACFYPSLQVKPTLLFGLQHVEAPGGGRSEHAAAQATAKPTSNYVMFLVGCCCVPRLWALWRRRLRSPHVTGVETYSLRSSLPICPMDAKNGLQQDDYP